jgi:hypothetical protein
LDGPDCFTQRIHVSPSCGSLSMTSRVRGEEEPAERLATCSDSGKCSDNASDERPFRERRSICPSWAPSLRRTLSREMASPDSLCDAGWFSCEAAGLIVRKDAGSDRHCVLLQLTPGGRKKLEALSIDHECELDDLAPKLIRTLTALRALHGKLGKRGARRDSGI